MNAFRHRHVTFSLCHLSAASNTPTPSYSNVCTGLVIEGNHILQALDRTSGVPNICADVYTNNWHRRLLGQDFHSPGKDPKYFYFTYEFYGKLMSRTPTQMAEYVANSLPVKQFWKLQYLFITISQPSKTLEGSGHVSLYAPGICIPLPDANFCNVS